MFSGFNLSEVIFHDNDDLEEFYGKGLASFNGYKTQVETSLQKYICEDNSLDGVKMQEDWFPQLQVDIFLSHAHKDEKNVIALAGWLKETFGIRVFVDSCIWGYAPNLLKIIDNKYCVSNKDDTCTTYSYEKRNSSTSHVYMMLSVALMKMIDKSESMFFYNTPSSFKQSSIITNGSTYSPWIYHELQTSKIIRHQPLSNYRTTYFAKDEYGSVLEHAGFPKVKYDITLEHLISIDMSTLNSWQEAYSHEKCYYALDKLYSVVGIFST